VRLISHVIFYRITLVALCLGMPPFLSPHAALADDTNSPDNSSTGSPTNSAPYLIPGLILEQGKWVKIVDFAGENGKNTPPFNITERQWRVSWTCKKLTGNSDASLTVTTQTDDTKLSAQEVCNTDREGADSTEMRGMGAYFFHVTSKCQWTLSIEQYIPTDQERQIFAAREEHEQNWQTLANYNGIGEHKTDSFTTTQDRWRVKWVSETPNGWSDDSLFLHVLIYKQNGPLMSEVCNTLKSGHDVMEFSGLGSFYFKVYGQAKWNITVQQTDK
jgi:hypothetical protein